MDYGLYHLRIHRTADDRVVAEYKRARDVNRIRLGGWVYDSSGVIFKEYNILYDTKSRPIAKLKVPDEP